MLSIVNIKDFVVANYKLVGTGLIIVVGISYLLFKRKKKQQIVSADIYDAMKQLRQLDKLLIDLHRYFIKIESKI